MSVLKIIAACVVLAAPAVPAPAMLTSALNIAAQARPSGSYVGITIADANGEQGAQVVRVTADGPADKAGLKAGDVLLTYNGEPILGGQQLGRLVWETPPGRRVKVQYVRNGKTAVATLTTAPPPIPARSVDTGSPQNWPPDFGSPMLSDIPVPFIAWRNMLLGVEYEPLTQQVASVLCAHDGVLIRAVATGSPAEKGGIKPGDVLTSLNGHPVTDRQDLGEALRLQNSHGKPIKVDVIRGHKQMQLTVVIPE
jgi:serine protease Do